MYNRYLDGSEFLLLDPEPGPGQAPPRPAPPRPGPARPKNDLLGEVSGGLNQLLEGVRRHFSLKNFDAGDVLLVLIILFLYLESGDNLELVITLALLLLLGLGDEEE